MPLTNVTALTTIGTLYDVLLVLFVHSQWTLKATRAQLSVRPDDKTLEQYFEYAVNFFELLRTHFPGLQAFFAATDTSRVVKRHPGSHGGTIMFRPIGLEIMTQVVARLTQTMTLERAVNRASKLPRELTAPPYTGLMWDASRNTITNAHKATLREVLLHTLGDHSKWGMPTCWPSIVRMPPTTACNFLRDCPVSETSRRRTCRLTGRALSEGVGSGRAP